MEKKIIDYVIILSTILFALFLYITNINSITENFIVDCSEARDGISGCRNCCSKNNPNEYQKCVDNCMNN